MVTINNILITNLIEPADKQCFGSGSTLICHWIRNRLPIVAPKKLVTLGAQRRNLLFLDEISLFWAKLSHFCFS
jgi:hypothetical protein